MRAIRIQDVGDPDVLQCVDLPTPEPGAGEARVKMEVAGVNFIDTYHRRGWYPMPLPFTPGVEGAGIVDAVGEGVTEVAVGDAVALRDVARLLRRICHRPLQSTGPSRRGCECATWRGGDDPGDDRALPGVHHLSAQAGRYLPGTCCGRRHRRSVSPDRQIARRTRSRDSIDRGEGSHRGGGRGRRHDSLYRSGLRRSGA